MGKKGSRRLTPVVFLDASVLVAGVLSRAGASRAVLDFGDRGLVVLRWTPQILKETLRNLPQQKQVLRLFFRLVARQRKAVVPDASPEGNRRWASLVDRKDAHVLAGAAKAKATHLLTLDRAHILTPTVAKRSLPFRVVSPGEFLRDLRTRFP